MREIQVEKKETQFYSEVLPKWVDRADKAGIDRLEFRIRNALQNGLPTATGQVFEAQPAGL